MDGWGQQRERGEEGPEGNGERRARTSRSRVAAVVKVASDRGPEGRVADSRTVGTIQCCRLGEQHLVAVFRHTVGHVRSCVPVCIQPAAARAPDHPPGSAEPVCRTDACDLLLLLLLALQQQQQQQQQPSLHHQHTHPTTMQALKQAASSRKELIIGMIPGDGIGKVVLPVRHAARSVLSMTTSSRQTF